MLGACGPTGAASRAVDKVRVGENHLQAALDPGLEVAVRASRLVLGQHAVQRARRDRMAERLASPARTESACAQALLQPPSPAGRREILSRLARVFRPLAVERAGDDQRVDVRREGEAADIAGQVEGAVEVLVEVVTRHQVPADERELHFPAARLDRDANLVLQIGGVAAAPACRRSTP